MLYITIKLNFLIGGLPLSVLLPKNEQISKQEKDLQEKKIEGEYKDYTESKSEHNIQPK